MGFFDRGVNGSLDRMFDRNHDGRLDLSEQILQLEFMEEESDDFEDYDEEDEY